VRYDDEVWTPSNSGGTYGGVVTLRRAIELSLNSATVRLGAATGLDAVSARARDMGVPVDEETGPAFLLGASSATPLQMVQAYGMLANRGATTSARGIRAIRGPQGPLHCEARAEPRQVLEPSLAYLVTSLLEGVVDQGTAGAVRRLGLRDRVAGKTGTSNDGRDSWFAGYTPDRATVVWVGFDDNRSSRWNGSRAALPLWTRFVIATRPAAGLPLFERPEGLVEEWIDPSTGELAGPYCPARVRDFVPLGRQGIACHRHREPDALGVANQDVGAQDGIQGVASAGSETSLDVPRMIFAVDERAHDAVGAPGQGESASLLAGSPLSTLALGVADSRQSLLQLARRDPAATAAPSVRLEMDAATTVDLAHGVPADPAEGIDVIELSGPMGWVVGYTRASTPAAVSSTGFE
jgi:membrane peptidoglycan carboxypeptidase